MALSPSKSWGIVAALPALAVTVVWLQLNQRVRIFFRCNYRLPHWLDFVVGPWLLLAVVAVGMAALLTIATEAARHPHHGPVRRLFWVFALLVAGPVAAPLYWALHLRKE